MPRWSKFEPYFWDLVEKTTACWIWKGGKDSSGYGRVWQNGKRQGAHRVAWKLTNGDIEIGKLVCHHCDNPICVNPSHLFIGTQKDNMQDWTQKGKNRLANDRTLWSNGKHWTTNNAAKEKLATLRRSEFSTGRRQVVRGDKGRLLGTKMRWQT